MARRPGALDGVFWSFSSSAASGGLLCFDQIWQNRAISPDLVLVSRTLTLFPLSKLDTHPLFPKLDRMNLNVI